MTADSNEIDVRIHYDIRKSNTSFDTMFYPFNILFKDKVEIMCDVKRSTYLMLIMKICLL